MAEWLFEVGIGEARAALVDNGVILEARIERPGLRCGAVIDARLTQILRPGHRGIATIASGEEILIEPLDRSTEGSATRIEIVREKISERGAFKRAKGRIVEEAPRLGPDLAMRIGVHRRLHVHDADLLEAAGWSECLDWAERGIIPFEGGVLRISPTPAMTLIDVDGDLPPEALALSGAAAAARAIRLFDVAGNIGIDLPTIGGKTARQAVAAAFDRNLSQPYERTSVNGFGFLQVIRPRSRPSLQEAIQYDPVGAAARAMIRRVQRERPIGSKTITGPSDVIHRISLESDWILQMSREFGGPVSLRDEYIASDTISWPF